MKSAERESLRVSGAGAPPNNGSSAVGPSADVPGGSGTPRLTRRWALSDPLVQDALIAAFLTAASLVGLLKQLHVDLPEGGAESGNPSLDGLGLALALLQTVPLVWRRVAPIVVFAVVASATFLFFTLGYFPSFASFGFLLALYTVAAHRERLISIPAALASVFVVVLILYMSREPVEIDTIFAECLVSVPCGSSVTASGSSAAR